MPPAYRPRRATADAVVRGLAAMLGTGVFIVFAPAAGLAGGWLPLAIVLAGGVAALAAMGSADLIARYPGPAAGYRAARELLPSGLSRVTGVAGVVGRMASGAAAARVFGAYVLPGNPVWLAVPLILVVGGVTVAGVRGSVRGRVVLVGGLLLVLAVVVAIGLTQHLPPELVMPLPGLPGPGAESGVGLPIGPVPARSGAAPLAEPLPPVAPLGVVCAAGLVFFAFAGFASAGPEPEPEAAPTEASAGTTADAPARSRVVIPVMMVIALLVYLAVAAALVHILGIPRLAEEPAPLVGGVGGTEAALGALVRVAAATATASALFGVLVGASATVAAMVATRDLPDWLAPGGAHATSWRTSAVGVVGAMLIAVLLGPVPAIALCACCALVHYAMLSLASARLPSARCWPRWVCGLGSSLCLGLAVLLPTAEVIVAGAVLVIGALLSTLYSTLRGRRWPGERGRGPAAGPGRAAASDDPGPPVRNGG